MKTESLKHWNSLQNGIFGEYYKMIEHAVEIGKMTEEEAKNKLQKHKKWYSKREKKRLYFEELLYMQRLQRL